MDKTELVNLINRTIDQKLGSMSNMAVGNHAHNGYDVNQLNPAIALNGWPVIQVANASFAPTVANPNDIPPNGTFRFYVDITPKYVLWAYLTYQDASGALVGDWKYLSLLP